MRLARDNERMSVNKFGMSLERRHDRSMIITRSSIESLRNYVHENTLRLNGDNYDARKHKIQRLDPPIDDTDAACKSYVDLRLERAVNDSTESVRGNIDALDAKHERKLQKLNLTVENIKSTLDSLGKDIQELRNLYDRIMIQLHGNKSLLENLRKEIRPVRNTLDESARDLSTLKKEIAEESEHLRSLRGIVRDLITILESVHKEHPRLQELHSLLKPTQ